MLRLFDGQVPGVDGLLRPTVIQCQQVDLPPTNQVGAAVAGVGQVQLIPNNHGSDHGCAHAAHFGRFLRFDEDLTVGGADGIFQAGAYILDRFGREAFHHRLNRRSACHLTTDTAADAIGHNGNLRRLGCCAIGRLIAPLEDGIIVFVVLSTASGIGLVGDNEVGIVRLDVWHSGLLQFQPESAWWMSCVCWEDTGKDGPAGGLNFRHRCYSEDGRTRHPSGSRDRISSLAMLDRFLPTMPMPAISSEISVRQ